MRKIIGAYLVKCQKNVKEMSTSVKSPLNVSYLQVHMNTYLKCIFLRFAITTLFLGMLSCAKESNTTFSETVKLALRDVGHNLLLASNDSTSVVKPVLEVGEWEYQLTFESPIIIQPDTLVTQIKASFDTAELPSNYLTEVAQCQDYEIAYSYAMQDNVENSIIPCSGRQLHENCYIITVKFTKLPSSSFYKNNWIYIVLLGALGLIVFLFYKQKSKSKTFFTILDENNVTLGKFTFYPDQNKLITEAREISLSQKECQLLTLFMAQPNQVITRDELTKKVWEDNGVFVGRSLDTFISKLRKKLQEDPSIKLINIHGVGYKLELHIV